jgi:3-methyl-2-oxobutanoate hydroxymethyltransferase
MKRSEDEIKAMKGSEIISMVTCYDYSFAKLLDGLVDIILVGDSLGNVVLGYDTTRKVEFNDMLRHTAAVARGLEQTYLVADLSHQTYDTPEQAIETSKKLIDVGAAAVKPEGSPEIVKALVDNGIPVMGHVGLLPQSVEKKTVQGREETQADAILAQAKVIDQAGAFTLVIECVPEELGTKITREVSCPTIGIGAGPNCDGQVLVLYDILGLFHDFRPKFVKHFGAVGEEVQKAVKQYTEEVKSGKFPTEEHSFK